MSYEVNRAVEAQASVIGAMLINEAVIGPILAELEPKDFIYTQYRRVFLAFRKLFTDGKPPDLVTVLDELKGDRGYSSDETAKLLRDCMEVTPTSANWQEYARIVRETARLEQIGRLCDELRDCPDLDSAAKVIAKLNDETVTSRRVEVVGMEEALMRFYARQEEKPDYLPWGIPKLDQVLRVGLGKYILLGGYPSDGKTALALAMAWEQSRQRKVGFFSFETEEDELMERLVATVVKIQMKRIMERTIRPADYERLAAKAEEITKRNLKLIPASGLDAQEILSVAVAHRMQVVYIDYIQILGNEDSEEEYGRITRFSRTLQRGAKRLGITVVALSQFNRADAAQPVRKPKKGEEGPVRVKAPSMRALRGSGQLEQDADAILLLYRPYPDDDSNPARCLDIAKNKTGRRGSIDMEFDGGTQTFFQVETPGEHYRQLQEDIAKAGRGEYVLPEEDDQIQFSELTDDEEVPFDQEAQDK